MPINNEPLIVTQADRDAAADYGVSVGWEAYNVAACRAGKLDDGEEVLAFARHRIKATSEAIERAAEWLPIETAPKDGEHILLARGRVPCGVGYKPEFVCEARWHDDMAAWVFGNALDPLLVDQDDPPTHWQPLPDPPAIRFLSIPGGEG
jgi:hypothetical protein